MSLSPFWWDVNWARSIERGDRVPHNPASFIFMDDHDMVYQQKNTLAAGGLAKDE
jgi:hypothetical protein